MYGRAQPTLTYLLGGLVNFEYTVKLGPLKFLGGQLREDKNPENFPSFLQLPGERDNILRKSGDNLFFLVTRTATNQWRLDPSLQSPPPAAWFEVGSVGWVQRERPAPHRP